MGMLEAANVTAYFSGHDHCAEHIDEGKGVQYHVVGASNQYDSRIKHKGDVPHGSLKWHCDGSIISRVSGAFAHVSIGKEGLVVSHYWSNGKKLYDAPPIPP